MELNEAVAYVRDVLTRTRGGENANVMGAPHPNSCDTVTVDLSNERVLNVDLNEDTLRWQFVMGSSVPNGHARLGAIRKEGWRSLTLDTSQNSRNELVTIIETYLRNSSLS